MIIYITANSGEEASGVILELHFILFKLLLFSLKFEIAYGQFNSKHTALHV